MINAEQLARMFYEQCEKLAIGYDRNDWSSLPRERRQLLIAAAGATLIQLFPSGRQVTLEATPHTYFRRIRRVEAWQYKGRGLNEAPLAGKIQQEDDTDLFAIVDRDGNYVAGQELTVGQWCVVDHETKEQWIEEEADFYANYEPAGTV